MFSARPSPISMRASSQTACPLKWACAARCAENPPLPMFSARPFLRTCLLYHARESTANLVVWNCFPHLMPRTGASPPLQTGYAIFCGQSSTNSRSVQSALHRLQSLPNMHQACHSFQKGLKTNAPKPHTTSPKARTSRNHSQPGARWPQAEGRYMGNESADLVLGC